MIRGEVALLLMMVPLLVGLFVESCHCDGYRGAIGGLVGFAQTMTYVFVCGVV